MIKDFAWGNKNMLREITITIYYDDKEELSLRETRNELIKSLENAGFNIKK